MQQSLLESRDATVLDQRFLPWILLSDELHAHAAAQATGSMNPRLLWSTLATFEFDLPPLDEQERIAELLWRIELQKLAVTSVADEVARTRAAWRDTVFGSPAIAARLDECAQVSLGRQRAPQHATGNHMRDYVRSANIAGGRVVMDDIKQINFTPAEQEKFRLWPGDVLVSEGTASPRELGSSAMWQPDDPDLEMYFQKTLLRLRARDGLSTPVLLREWASWAQESGAFLNIATGTGILHITGVRCASMPFPVLTTGELDALGAHADLLRDAATSVQAEADEILALQESVIREVFGGN